MENSKILATFAASMKKSVIHLLAIIILLSACGGRRVSERLNDIDSLIVKEHYDSAYSIIDGLKRVTMNDENTAHYYLIITQLGYLTNHPLTSDSLLDLALSYYRKVGNNRKLADAYYYKSIRERNNQNYPRAILFCKEAERLAANNDDVRLQFKIAENLSYLNSLCDNNKLQLHYAQKALAIALKIQNKNWIAYSYSKISYAYAYLDQYDSSYYYADKSIPYVEYVKESDKAKYLANIGLLYVDNNPNKAKYYFEKALEYGEHPGIYEFLADIYDLEGKQDEAYRLWKKALSTSGKHDKDNLLYSILSYDIKHGRLDRVCKNVEEIMAIKDSIITKVKNDTIKDLQLRFDHEVAMHDADKKLITTQRVAMALALLLILMVFYIYFRKRREEMVQKELQMQLYAYTTEIKQLKEAKDNTIAQIKDFESDKDKYSRKIDELEENVKNADVAIKELNKSIRKLLDNEAPKLKLGRELYDSIMTGGTAVEWHSKEENLFNNYYSCINYSSYIKLKKGKRKSNLSPHNLFYLILKDMGKSDDEIRRIMALSPEGLRSLRSRTKPI